MHFYELKEEKYKLQKQTYFGNATNKRNQRKTLPAEQTVKL